MLDFFHSQLFGIILGAVLTGGFSFVSDMYKSARDEKNIFKTKKRTPISKNV